MAARIAQAPKQTVTAQQQRSREGHPPGFLADPDQDEVDHEDERELRPVPELSRRGQRSPEAVVDQHDDQVHGEGHEHGQGVPGRSGPPGAEPSPPARQAGPALAGDDHERGHHRTQRVVAGIGAEAESGRDVVRPAEQAGQDARSSAWDSARTRRTGLVMIEAPEGEAVVGRTHVGEVVGQPAMAAQRGDEVVGQRAGGEVGDLAQPGVHRPQQRRPGE